MKKLLLLTIIALFINGCRYINTKEKYVDATKHSELTIPAGVDKPNSSSTLEIPKVNTQQALAKEPNRAPPDMPIRTKQSENGGLRIENIGGFPVLSVKTDKIYMWEAMTTLEIENWAQASIDEELCVVALEYTDKEANERKNAGFIKKLFTRDKFYTDYSGIYTMTCSQNASTTQVKFANKDGTAAKSFLADSVMTKLYEKFE